MCNYYYFHQGKTPSGSKITRISYQICLVVNPTHCRSSSIKPSCSKTYYYYYYYYYYYLLHNFVCSIMAAKCLDNLRIRLGFLRQYYCVYVNRTPSVIQPPPPKCAQCNSNTRANRNVLAGAQKWCQWPMYCRQGPGGWTSNGKSTAAVRAESATWYMQ